MNGNNNYPKKTEPLQINTKMAGAVQIIQSGPLPNPEVLAKYDSVLPGAAERILKMAENQALHRQKMEEKAIFSKAGDARLGVWFAFILAVIALVGGGFLIYNNKSGEGLATIITAIAGLTGVFVYGKYKDKKELDKKENALINKK